MRIFARNPQPAARGPRELDVLFVAGRAAAQASAVWAGLRARYPRGELRARICQNMLGGLEWAERYSCGAVAGSAFSTRAVSLNICILSVPISRWIN